MPGRTNKVADKNRWLLSRDLAGHLHRAGIGCDIVVPESLAAGVEADLSPGERAALALVAAGAGAHQPNDGSDLIAAIRNIKRRH